MTEPESACTPCPPGQSSFNSLDCVVCKPGYYSDAYAQSTCSSCGSGQYSERYGSTQCTNCPAFPTTSTGTQCASPQTQPPSSPLTPPSSVGCGVGYYRVVPAGCLVCIGECIACELGKYTNTADATQCTMCSFGKYTNSVGSTECISCAVGKYATAGSEECLECEPGKYTVLLENVAEGYTPCGM